MQENENQKLLYALSGVLMKNEQSEAEAIEGYNEQLKIIQEVKAAFASEPDFVEFLNKLEAATQEKIQDELNHGESLYREYIEMTGITPKED